MILISVLLKFSILPPKQAAHFHSYLSIDIGTVKTEDCFAEDHIVLPRLIVSDGSQPLAIGPSQTNS